MKKELILDASRKPAKEEDITYIGCGINLYEKALRNPKEFIRDWIGKPLQIGMNKTSYEVMKQIQDLMYKYHIELIYRHGKMYLECFEDDVSLCLNEYLPDD